MIVFYLPFWDRVRLLLGWGLALHGEAVGEVRLHHPRVRIYRCVRATDIRG
jgi:hypothetical protein